MVTKAKIYALLIICMFLFPLVGAFIMYNYRDNLHLGSTNNGNLITPPLNITQIAPLNTHDGKWQLIYLAAQPCDEACTKNVYYVNQIHTALGKKMSEMVPGVVKQDALALQEKYPKLNFYTLNNAELGWLNQQLPQNYQISNQGSFFLIDPHGYLIMHYPFDSPPKSILKDLKHLIRS